MPGFRKCSNAFCAQPRNVYRRQRYVMHSTAFAKSSATLLRGLVLVAACLFLADSARADDAKSIAGFTTLNDLIQQLPTSLRDAVPFDHLGLALHDADRDVLKLVHVHPYVPLPMREVPVDFGPAGVVLRSQQTMVVRLDTGEALGISLDRVRSANAYLGAEPIVEALARAPTS